MNHRYSVGQIVTMISVHNRVKAGSCEIVRLMPIERGAEPAYQVKRVGEPFERVARESELEE